MIDGSSKSDKPGEQKVQRQKRGGFLQASFTAVAHFVGGREKPSCPPARYDQQADEQLMLNYAKGDTAAFECLYLRHKDALYRFCLRHLRKPVAAQDCAQEVWFKIIHFKQRYQPSARFKTFLYRVAQNAVIDALRKSKPQLLEDELSSVNEGELLAQTDCEGFSQGEKHEKLRAAITQLPLDQKTALLLKIDAGLSLQEIADVMGCGRETVKSKLRYANAKIKRSLEEQNDET
jgi:RNA polymerase sigma-70 factor (ECF subfamily)